MLDSHLLGKARDVGVHAWLEHLRAGGRRCRPLDAAAARRLATAGHWMGSNCACHAFSSPRYCRILLPAITVSSTPPACVGAGPSETVTAAWTTAGCSAAGEVARSKVASRLRANCRR